MTNVIPFPRTVRARTSAVDDYDLDAFARRIAEAAYAVNVSGLFPALTLPRLLDPQLMAGMFPALHRPMPHALLPPVFLPPKPGL